MFIESNCYTLKENSKINRNDLAIDFFETPLKKLKINCSWV